ncbi:hypothetical protein HHI36_004829 [Cryptolaemus montrouzieri]|uniref:Uncharacterized protein n=1 Tax=Cryptolaemus montrouzieri TaxID=559131 RepID=A0ABD2NSD2_9CUCU
MSDQEVEKNSKSPWVSVETRDLQTIEDVKPIPKEIVPESRRLRGKDQMECEANVHNPCYSEYATHDCLRRSSSDVETTLTKTKLQTSLSKPKLDPMQRLAQIHLICISAYVLGVLPHIIPDKKGVQFLGERP